MVSERERAAERDATTASGVDGRDGDRNTAAPWLRVLVAVVMAATVIVVLLPQAGPSAANLRPLALGLVGLGVVAWLAGRRRRQATPARGR
jgi:hypothetical protein